MGEQQSPQCGLVPPPLPSPGSAGGSHGHENNMGVKLEAVAGAMREPHNKHPRKAADAALVMIKLAHVAAHAGHEPAACFVKGKLGSERGTKGAAATPDPDILSGLLCQLVEFRGASLAGSSAPG